MYFPFNCLGCGHENHAGWSQIGERLSCRVCGRAAIVPAPMEPVEGGTRWEFVVRFACLICGRSFAAKPELVGQKIRCSGCGAGVRVPAGNSFPVEHETRIVLQALSGRNRALAPPTEPTRGERPPADRSIPAANPWWRDPNDGTSDSDRSNAPTTGPRSDVRPPAGHSSPVANPWPVPPDDDSGDTPWIAPSTTDAVPAAEARSEIDPWRSQDQLEAIADFTRSEHAAVVLPSRGEMVEPALQEVAKQEAAEVAQVAEKAKKAKKKRRKKSGLSDLKETLTMLGGVGVVVAVLGFVAWRFPESRFPLAGLLVVIGAVLYLLGAMSLSRVAEHESFLKSMAFRFFPPYQWWYVVMHWEDTRDFMAFIVSGVIILGIGLGVYRTSNTFLEAEKANRDYQIAVDEAVHGKLAKPLAPLTDKTAAPKN